MTAAEKYEALSALEISSVNPGTNKWTIHVGEMPAELACELEAKIIKLLYVEQRKARKAMTAGE